jgi:hypothetical protein
MVPVTLFGGWNLWLAGEFRSGFGDPYNPIYNRAMSAALIIRQFFYIQTLDKDHCFWKEIMDSIRAARELMRIARLLAASPMDVMKFINRVYDPSGNGYNIKKLSDEFNRIFGGVTESEADRIIEAGYKESQRGMDEAQAIQLKYERIFPGKGRRMMELIADGQEYEGFTVDDAKRDMKKYVERMSYYNGIRRLMDLVWKLTRKDRS